MMTSLGLRPQVVVSAGEDGPCACDCEDGLIYPHVSCAIISIPPTPLGLGYDIIIMSSCYSSSAPCIIIHASSSGPSAAALPIERKRKTKVMSALV